MVDAQKALSGPRTEEDGCCSRSSSIEEFPKYVLLQKPPDEAQEPVLADSGAYTWRDEKKPEPPKEVEPRTTPRVPAPGQADLSEAELIARKLISTDPGDNLEVLNEALERWLAEKGALPERVSDLVGEQFLPMLPMAPLGKAFMIDAENRRVIIIVAEK